MKNILIFSDLHITQDSLKECEQILNEIGSIAKRHDCDTIFNLGDTFDILKPGSQELDLFATWVDRLAKEFDVIFLKIISADSHESSTEKDSVINHFGILNETISVIKEYKDGNDLFCGHFIVKGAKKDFGTTHTQEELKDYRYSFLGHQHSFEQLGNIYQLGSCRYISFDEYTDKKVVAIITDYKGPSEKVSFIALKSPIIMKQIELCEKRANNTTNLSQNTPVEAPILKKRGRPRKCSTTPTSFVSEGQSHQNSYTFEALCQVLDNLDPITKVKIIIKDFPSYKQFINVEDNYKKKFVKFIRVNDFSLVSEIGENKNKQQISLRESFTEFVKEKNVDTEIVEIIKGELK